MHFRVQPLPKTWTDCGVDINLDNLSFSGKYQKSLLAPSVNSLQNQPCPMPTSPGWCKLLTYHSAWAIDCQLYSTDSMFVTHIGYVRSWNSRVILRFLLTVFYFFLFQSLESHWKTNLWSWKPVYFWLKSGTFSKPV